MLQNQSLERSDRSDAFTARRHESLETLEPVWRLLETEGRATAFQQFDWVRAVEEHLARPKGITAFVVEVSDAKSGRTRMLLPFILKKKAAYSIVEYMGLNVCDISAPLIAPGYRFTESSGEALWAAIATCLPKADLVHIDLIPSMIQGEINPLATLPGIRRISLQSFDVAIDGDPETIVERLVNGRTRRSLKKSSRRLAERGDVRFMEATSRENLEALLPVMIAQRLERFRALDRFDLLADPQVQSFYTDAAIRSLQGRGPVRVFGLSVAGEWIATAYGLVHAKTFHLLIVSMAGGGWEASAPGIAIIAQFVRWSRQQGLTMMDFSLGEMDYKTGFGGQPHDLYALSLPLTSRGRVAAAMRHAAARTKERLMARPRLFAFLRPAVRLCRRMTSPFR